MDPFSTARPAPADPEVLLLQSLAWICADDDRGARLLNLTGLDADSLRARATEPAILAATGDFLASHEADLVDCAAAIGCAPRDLVAATAALSA